MAGLEFKRKKLLSDIINNLDSQRVNNVGSHTVLLLGKSGSAKSTILMELICHYFKEQYIVLYNLRQTKIEDVEGIVKFIEGKLEAGKVDGKENKILVAIDNVHNERTATIFSILVRTSWVNFFNSLSLESILFLDIFSSSFVFLS